MKRCVLIFMIAFCGVHGRAQSFEVQQLLLNVEKLSQFKKILQNMYDGYKVLHAGYTTIRDISQGSFHLHKTFLDALLEVSPAVRNYKRVKDIIMYQSRIIADYKAAFNEFKAGGNFTYEEIDYFGNVYTNLLKESGERIEELLLVITAGKLRMSDEERLAAIDRIYASVEEQFTFLKNFNSNTALLALQRKHQKADIELSKKVFGF